MRSLALSRSASSDERVVNQTSTPDGLRPAFLAPAAQAGAGNHAIEDSAAKMQGLGPFGTESDGNAVAHRLAMPADPLWPTVVRALAGCDQIRHAG